MIEIRDAHPNFWVGSGWATTWSNGDRGAYFVHDPRQGIFLERVQRGAFPDAISGRDHVELRLEHDPDSPVFASTAGGSLSFTDMTDGLHLAAALAKSHRATATAVERVHAGDLTGLSVGMVVTSDTWTTAADGRTALRTICRATLNEVSMVRRPANPAAVITAVRHEQRTATGQIEYRSVALVLDHAKRVWANQHGRECATCEGSGQCPDCEGAGWVANGDSGTGRAGGRPGCALPPSRLAEFEIELAVSRTGRYR